MLFEAACTVRKFWLRELEIVKRKVDAVMMWYSWKTPMTLADMVSVESSYQACVSLITKPIVPEEMGWKSTVTYRRFLFRSLVFVTEVFDVLEILKGYVPAREELLCSILSVINPFMQYLCHVITFYFSLPPL